MKYFVLLGYLYSLPLFLNFPNIYYIFNILISQYAVTEEAQHTLVDFHMCKKDKLKSSVSFNSFDISETQPESGNVQEK